MKSCSRLLSLRIGALLALMGVTRIGFAQSVETIDAPNSSATFPQAINEFGRITGYYYDGSSLVHGFVRSRFGSLTSFDAPSVGDRVIGTQAQAINALGQITGSVYGASGETLLGRGFVRNEFGTITEFDAASDAIRTEPQAINVLGWIAGTYLDPDYRSHGFVRSPRGSISTFDSPEFFAFVREIRPDGAVIGAYQRSHGDFHGFMRDPNGMLSTFDAPSVDMGVGSVFCGRCSGTYATAATAIGQVVGYYGATGGGIHGFLRTPDGAMTSVDVPDAIRTEPAAINLLGAIAGTYDDPVTYLQHGFLLPSPGALESFDVPGTYGMAVTGIDLANDVIGHYVDLNGTHGFIRRPR